MSKLKNFDEFVNENLVIGGNYSYFGQGSLDPIIQKLLGEGKNESIIRSYLTSLGVEAWRIDNAMAKFGGAEFTGEKHVTEAAKKATFEDKANKFLNDLNEEDDTICESCGKVHEGDCEVEESEISEAKKKTFEDAAAAFLLGLAGSDQVDEEKVDEKLNKETLQVEGDGEDIDDMIDDLADGDEDEFQGADDEAPESDDKDEEETDLDKAVKSAKLDKEKLNKIKDILMGEGEEVELDADGEEETDKEDIEDEETGDEVEVEEPAEESVKVEEADDKWSAEVEPKWTPPAGLFTEPAAKIADVLHKDSEDLDQAMSRLVFYINRAGKLLSDKDKANLELAKKLLQQKYA
jgi:hypothetical protein